jgi:hypothetical protein
MKKLFNVWSFVLIVSMVLTTAVIASDVDVAVVDVTAPIDAVTLAPGETASITINMSVTGQQAGTATFEIYRDWTLDAGVFVGSNAEEFTVPPRAAQDSATTFTAAGTVTVASTQAAGGPFILEVGAFDITNSNATGAKLAAGDSSHYEVTVTGAPADTTEPVISYTVNGEFPPVPDGDNGWYVSDAFVEWTVTDPESAVTIDEGCVDTTINYDTTGVTLSCTATSAGGTAGPVTVTIKRDATKPTISAAITPDVASTGWWNLTTGAPTVTYTCDDATSGVASCTAPYLFGEGASQSHTGTAVDYAGNSKTASVTDVNVDLTAPGITWEGGPAAGGSYYFGFVPAAPTCTATDVGGSGPDGCEVTGYGTSLGSQTMTATAYDVAGNKTEETRSYTVLAWTLTGFYRPVDMNKDNAIKGGRTVPLKFHVFAGGTELTDPAFIGAKLSWQYIGSDSVDSNDNVIGLEETGGTALRYDATEGQFIFNWKTPTKTGRYTLTLTLADSSYITAVFIVAK